MAIKHMDTVQVHVLSSDMTETAWWDAKKQVSQTGRSLQQQQQQQLTSYFCTQVI